MLPIVFAAFMSLPVYPLNPTVQDTLEVMNLHITAGIDGPNGVISLGPDFSVKYEMLLFHPFVFRPTVDIQYGAVNTATFPDGKLTTLTLAAEMLAYRGTDQLTGYLGTGLTYSSFNFSPSDEAADSLYENRGVTKVNVNSTLGYRLTLGLRYKKSYSVEFGITEVRPLFVYQSEFSSNQYAQYSKKSRMSNVRFTIGYLFPLRLF